MSKLLITGVPKGLPNATDPGSRQEITTFIQDHKQFSLYIQALDKMMYGVDPTDVDSYFSLAGVHGWPTVDWNESPSNGNIFCAHRSEHFPTWHRPYVAVFEQVIHKHAVAIAATYTTPDKEDWKKAAANIRQPYWGWDKRETFVPPPEVISMEEVTITFPDGKQGKKKNPLFSYTFPDSFPTGFQKDFDRLSEDRKKVMRPYLSLKKTVRHCEVGGTESQPEKLVEYLTASLEDTTKSVHDMLGLTTWRDMVFGRGTDGLENIHGGIHVMTGGSREGTRIGHMQQVPVAGFDPIFWLHHSQVDRLTEMWGARHKKWVANERDLNPFWKSQTVYWKSSETADAETNFNYSFESPRATFPIIASVDKGGVKVPAKFLPVDAEAELPKTLLDLEKATMPFKSLPPAARAAASTISLAPPKEDTTLKEWTVQVRIKRFELPASFIVCIFVGNVPEDAAQWVASDGFAGSFEVFDNAHPEACPACSASSEDYIYGFVNCNFTIISHMESENPNFEDENVIPLLKKKLSWGVIEIGRGVVDLKKVPSLEVTFGYCPLTLPFGEGHPTRGDPKFFPEIVPDYKTTH